MTNRKYTCAICDAEFEHDSDEPLDECLKCDGEDTDHIIDYSYKCPFCGIWMEYDTLDEVHMCRQCDSYFPDYELIAHTLKCLAFYKARIEEGK